MSFTLNIIDNAFVNVQHDLIQDSPISRESMMESDDGETRSYKTAQSDTPSQNSHFIFDAEPLNIDTTGLPRCIASLTGTTSSIDTLFGQLSMYNGVVPLSEIPASFYGPESAITNQAGTELVECRDTDDVEEIQTPQVRSDDMVFGLANDRFIQLEKAIHGINESVNSLASVVMANLVIQPPQLTATSFPVASRAASSPAQRLTPAYLPKRRSAQTNALARKVRALLKVLLGPNMFEVDNLMSREEIDAFAAIWTQNGKIAVCCDIQNFRLDFVGPPRSPWNQSASRVFINHFVGVHGVAHTHVAIQFAFFRRVRSLQLAYRESLSSPSIIAEELARQKRLSRMRALFRKRVRLASKHPMVAPHLDILGRIGIQGMSSDESDFDDRPAKYHVHIPRWRSPELSSWLHAIDELEKYFRVMTGTTTGALPRLRIHSANGPVTNKRFVRGLPKSAYNENWLATLVDPTHDAMITQETYHFAHDNRLFSYFNRNSISNSAMA